EYKIQDYNPPVGGNPIKYPTILGSDMAGTVVEVGSEVTRWKVGDRLMAHTFGATIGQPAKAAFQNYTAREVVLVWGGSSSVGCVAIQMAVAAGYEVFATASPRNHELCKSLGAATVFDYGKAEVEAEMLAALQGKQVAGALDCIADNDKTIPALGRILMKVDGKKKIVAVLQPAEVEGIEVQRVSIPDLVRSEQYGQVHAWMASALENGSLQCKPDPMVVGEGLGSIQKGVDVSRKGVSAAKVVVKLE
ncbi:hypothetical protein M409DRAFT_38088, partial [Zasmidium cellare ATCC 36951]